MNDASPFSRSEREPRLYGVIDVLRSDRVAGWVIDRTDASRSATVEIRREGQLVGSVVANRQRKDLERQAVGTGAYGFAFTFDPPLAEGMEFTVALTAKSHDGVTLPLQTVARAATPISAEKKVLGLILSEMRELRADLDGLRQEIRVAEERRELFHERVEMIQLRLECVMPDQSASLSASSSWPVRVVLVGGIIAVGSLVLAVGSLWAG